MDSQRQGWVRVGEVVESSSSNSKRSKSSSSNSNSTGKPPPKATKPTPVLGCYDGVIHKLYW